MPTTQDYQRQLYLRIRALAREMRKHPTPAEEFFWSQVRNRQLFGLKFTRQHVIQCPVDSTFTKYYIADFFCHACNLVVELDGKIHLKQMEADLIRTELLRRWNYNVLRLTNAAVLQNWDLVKQRIREHV